MFEKTKKEIDLMNKPFSMGDEGDEGDVKTDPSTTEEPDDEIKTEPPTTEEPDEDRLIIKPTDAPTTDAPDDRDQIISDLRAKLSEKDVTTKAPTTKSPITFEDQDFLKDLDIEEVVRDSKEFNKLLNSIYQKAVTDTQKNVGVEVTQAIPNMISVVTNLQKATDTFYDENEDLKPFKKVVAQVFDDLVITNPDKPYSELMSDVAPEVRKRLELPEYVKIKETKKSPPKLPSKKKKPGQAGPKRDLSSLEEGINAMNETLRR